MFLRFFYTNCMSCFESLKIVCVHKKIDVNLLQIVNIQN